MASEVHVGIDAGDELTRYLADARVETTEPLAWWVANKSLYPNLARMAIDFHTIPASSVAVERNFSRGRILITHLRNRLRAKTVQALMCLGDWLRQHVITMADVVHFLEHPDDADAMPDLDFVDN
ncbi:hATC-domain-containing protein [Cylindrobasidium torrendii FP15055 ss-10]|uniref:HATC-domain-containing protein n=1 Tax=Cylindrobasidium torrendii FP15055 ss-10 TaxID=1314674 RepID=A0A0D7AWQ5_9AGAR|nr:hATC-domain-containing protein [Cylindrobasidium torrendii FP15055 ss-10]